jgi:hypothetical protein
MAADLHARRRSADPIGVVDDRHRKPQHAILDRRQRGEGRIPMLGRSHSGNFRCDQQRKSRD